MGIRFYCPACDKKINVKDHQAGLRGICPKCGTGVDIPFQSAPKRKGKPRDEQEDLPAPSVAEGAAGEQTMAAVLPKLGRLVAVTATPPADPLAEFPHYQWYVVPQGATEPFGPADGSLLRQWLQEGRIAARSLVWRQDWPEWRKAGGVWSQLVLAEADAIPSHVERRAASAVPRFQSPSVPSMPPAPAASQVPARRPWSAPPPNRPTPSAQPVGFGEDGEELYYPQRSGGLYLTAVVLLALAVVALGFVMWGVIDQLKEKQPPTPESDETSQRATVQFLEATKS